MRIGLDFDNTIVCYDEAIIRLAEKIFDLPKELALTKTGLRDYLRRQGREPDWTSFQGELYGPGMKFAQPYNGCIEAINKLLRDGHTFFIISHRSKHPYGGQNYDMHAHARNWINTVLYSRIRTWVLEESHENTFFMETKQDKLQKIKELRIDYFLDDLPEMVDEAKKFVSGKSILFDPNNVWHSYKGAKATSWDGFIGKLRK